MSVLPVGFGSALGGYQIERSLRFNSADSAYLSRTPASAGNRKTWTWSGWVKKSKTSSAMGFLSAGTNGNQIFFAGFGATDDKIYIHNGVQGTSTASWAVTSAVYRDPSAWYHIVLAVDTTQATDTNRIKLYVNNQLQTLSAHSGASTYPTQNYDTAFNNNVIQEICYGYDNASKSYFDGYLTEINFIDGSAKTPSDFGETDSNTGVWKPKVYSGTYGTNGFFLKFADNSGTTSTTLGKDSSGNGNNWTPNNFSVTAGVGNDSLVDTPTSYGSDTGVGGEVRGNYATLNPLDKSTNIVLANGNLQATNSVGAIENLRSTMPTASTYSYWEVTASVVGSSLRMDLGGILLSYVQSVSNTAYLAGVTTGTFGANWDNGFKFFINASNVYSSGTANLVANDVVMFAHDSSTGKIWVGLNGTWYNSGNPAAGTGNVGTLNAEAVFPAVMVNGGGGTNGVYINFGQRPFAYTAPSGFKALCTQNLPTPTIGATSTTQANDYMNVVLYTGDGANPRTVSGVGFQPDFVWTKSRSSAFDHWLFDAVRGATKTLTSNSTSAEITYANSLKSFISDGFTVGDLSDINANGGSYVAWNWKANGAGSTNTAGTITSTVSANTTSGFSIVTYTGTGATATVGHGLGVTPAMYIVKRRTGGVGNWAVWHTGLSNTTTSYILLDSTAAQSTSTSLWGSTAATSTTIGVGTSVTTNNSSDTYVAYCFAPVAGYSAFGSYTGNGSTDGPFVYTGFRPRWIMWKPINQALTDWVIRDATRDPTNIVSKYLLANTSGAEGSINEIDILSNGFKFRNNLSGNNSNGITVIYAAFAEAPFKYSLAR